VVFEEDQPAERHGEANWGIFEKAPKRDFMSMPPIYMAIA
jgi:hypothetical protein